MKLTPFDIDQVVEHALVEDLSAGDPTTDGLIPPELQGRALVIAKTHGVLAGSARRSKKLRSSKSRLL